MTNTLDNPQDWLDEALNNLVEDHIDIPSMDKDSGLAWIEDYRTARSAIQTRFTAQAKQHQLDLAQSKLAIYKKVQKTLQAGQLPVVATVFDAEITQLEREVAVLTKLTGKEIK